MYANKIRFNKFIVTNYQTVKGMKFRDQLLVNVEILSDVELNFDFEVA